LLKVFQLLLESRTQYNLCKYVFTNRVVNIWNTSSLPNHVVLCDTVYKFTSRLDKFWQYQELVYDYKADIHFTEARVHILESVI